MLNKKDMVKLVATKTEFTQKDTEAVVDALLETIQEKLVEGEEIKLAGFGQFETTERAEREGRNPKTGESLMIKASRGMKFKPAKALKDALNA